MGKRRFLSSSKGALIKVWSGAWAPSIAGPESIRPQLFLDLHPNAVSASVEERRLEQPGALAVTAEALSTEVEIVISPFSVSHRAPSAL